MKKIIGMTTGFAHKTICPISTEAIRVCKQVSADIVELNCIGGTVAGELYLLEKIKPEDLREFKHVSLHAPSVLISYRNNTETERILNIIEAVYHRLNIEYVVFHPDTVSDFSVFKKFNFRVAMENMDSRKLFGKSVDDMKKVFEFLDCRFVLDVNHCFSIDPTLKLAENFITAFKDRLCGVHISGHKEYHDLLYETGQTEIIEAVADLDVPMVIESRCADEKEAKKELDYIRSYFVDRRK